MTQPAPPPLTKSSHSPFWDAVRELEKRIRAEAVVSFAEMLESKDHPEGKRMRFLQTMGALHRGPDAFRTIEGHPTKEMDIFGAANAVANSERPFTTEAIQQELGNQLRSRGYGMPPGGIGGVVFQAKQMCGEKVPPFEACAGAYNHIAISRDLSDENVATPGGHESAQVIMTALGTHRDFLAQRQKENQARQNLQDFQNTPHRDSAKQQAYAEKGRKRVGISWPGVATGAAYASTVLLGLTAGASIATFGAALLPAAGAGIAVAAARKIMQMNNSRNAKSTAKAIATERDPIEAQLNGQAHQAGTNVQHAGQAAQNARQRLYQPIAAPRGR